MSAPLPVEKPRWQRARCLDTPNNRLANLVGREVWIRHGEPVLRYGLDAKGERTVATVYEVSELIDNRWDSVGYLSVELLPIFDYDARPRVLSS